MATTSTTIQIRPPQPHERPAWCMLLPEATASIDPCDVLVATTSLPDRDDVVPHIIAAIALTRSYVLFPVPGPLVCLHVIPPFRRCGVGRALIATATSIARNCGAHAIYAWSILNESSAELAAWQRLGFDRVSILVDHEMPLAPMIVRLDPVYDQLLHAGRIPGDALLIDLAHANAQQREQIVELHSTQLGGTPAEIRTRLSQVNPPYYLDDVSLIVVHRDRVVGFTLTVLGPDGRSCTAEAVVVDPACRGRWANVWLKLASARRSVARGLTHIRFQTFEHNRETRSFTGKLGATTTAKRVQLYRMTNA